MCEWLISYNPIDQIEVSVQLYLFTRFLYLFMFLITFKMEDFWVMIFLATVFQTEMLMLLN